MKPLMLIPPAQAEALYDAQQEAPADRAAPIPWLDEDFFEDDPRPRTTATAADSQDRRPGLRRRAA